MNNMPNPIRKGAILLSVSFLLVKTIMTPTKAKDAKTALMLKLPLLTPERAKMKAVRVVPAFAPKMKPEPCLSFTGARHLTY
jgi:hypothetical protein